MRMWLSRFKGYPLECLSHIAWGFGAGVLSGIHGGAYAVPGAMLLAGGWAYQFGSGWRKAGSDGQVDTVGLDAADYAVGYAAGIAAALLWGG